MPRTITFHVGAPKTGTSSIQRFLFQNRNLLRDAGVVYPSLDLDPQWNGSYSHTLLVFALTGLMKYWFTIDQAKAREIVSATVKRAAAVPGADHLLFSHEMLYPDIDSVDVKYMRSLVGDAKVRIVLYARRLDDWSESLYRQFIWGRTEPQETIHHNKVIYPIERTQHVVHIKRRTVTAVAEFYRENFGAELVVRPYSQFQKGGGLVADFLTSVGLDSEAIMRQAVPQTRENESRPGPATILMWQLQRTNLPTDKIFKIGEAALKMSRAGKEAPGFDGRRFRFLPEGVARQAFDLYLQDVARFESLAPDRDIVFTPESRVEHELTRDDIERLLNWLSPELPPGAVHEAHRALGSVAAA